MSGLMFNENTHEYSVGGVKLTSVTTVMKRAGLVDDWYYTDEVANFGNYGHLCMHLMLLNELEDYDPQFEPWMRGIRKFLEEQQPGAFEHHLLGEALTMQECSERRMGSLSLGYTGTLDFVGTISGHEQGWATNRFPVILDWKFWTTATKKVVDAAGVQLAGYEKLFKTEVKLNGLRMRRAVVHFAPERYDIYECNDPADWPAFLSALNCVKWRDAH